MRIVRIKSGLGNQMFQYALYKALRQEDENVQVDLSYVINRKEHAGYELKKIFDIELQSADPYYVEKYMDNRMDVLSKLRRKLGLYKKTYYPEKIIGFDENLSNRYNVIFDGYWQSELYFKHLEREIRNDFKFRNELLGKNKKISLIIEKSNNSVSLHVRRGDYLNPEFYKKFGSVCDETYYRKACNYINSQLDNPIYFIFSNDIDWCRENIKINNANFVDWNLGDNAYIDMQLMSMCEHNIIANSSFSWWGAWLNKNPNKIVVAPSKWFNDKSAIINKLIPEKWIKIE